jgi:hypothetical protein
MSGMHVADDTRQGPFMKNTSCLLALGLWPTAAIGKSAGHAKLSVKQHVEPVIQPLQTLGSGGASECWSQCMMPHSGTPQTRPMVDTDTFPRFEAASDNQLSNVRCRGTAVVCINQVALRQHTIKVRISNVAAATR